MEDPDDPARQDEVARRLLAYAAKLKAKQEHAPENALQMVRLITTDLEVHIAGEKRRPIG